MPPSIVTLTTDFGLRDHYVGTMKGVILGRSPQTQLIDITHEIEPFSIYTGAYAISQAAPYFPPGTVHVVVVDPGVGTARKPLLVEASEQFFIAPDNGVLSFILARDRHARIREISNRSLWVSSPSQTFHGRDVFAPVAAALADGQIHAAHVGPLLDEALVLPNLEPVNVEDGRWRGIVLSVDRFGNVITNLPATRFGSVRFSLTAGSRKITARRESFAGADPGACFTYSGSSGYLEIAVNQGNAAERLGVSPGNSVELDFGH